MKKKPIPVGISNRHLHIATPHFETLFGKGHPMGVYRNISQKGQFAANETVAAIGPKGRIERIRIVGPARGQTQLEISRSDAFRLGIDPPVRYSGDLQNTPGVKLVGPVGEVDLQEGVIVPQRHIHIDPRGAAEFGVRDRERVFVAPLEKNPISLNSEARSIIFGNVLIRVDDTFVLDFHVDADEANAAGLKSGDHVFLIKKDKQSQPVQNKRLITENDVRQAMLRGRKITPPPGAIVTPAALDLAKAHDVFEE